MAFKKATRFLQVNGLTCPACGKTFSTWPALAGHIGSHGISPGKKKRAGLPTSSGARTVLPSPAQIRAERTPAGGWTRKTLAEWGVPWPPPRGWKVRLESEWRDLHGG